MNGTEVGLTFGELERLPVSWRRCKAEDLRMLIDGVSKVLPLERISFRMRRRRQLQVGKELLIVSRLWRRGVHPTGHRGSLCGWWWRGRRGRWVIHSVTHVLLLY